MARLPVVGSDDGTWGAILNDYLSQQHGAGGEHLAVTIPDTTQAATGIVLGADTNLYRAAANTLKTDDGFVATGTITGSNLKRGTGSPEGVVAGSVGDVYQRSDGGTGTTFYVKESGSATNTGWVAIATESTSFPLTYSNATATTDDLIRSKLTADTEYRFNIDADGAMEWGAGGVTARDTNLYRSATNTLKTDDSFEVAGSELKLSAGHVNVDRNGAGSIALQARVAGDSFARLQINNQGRIEIGNGTAARDTTLYRVVANTLRTDGYLEVGEDIIAAEGVAAQTWIGDLTGSGASGLSMGLSAPTTLRRGAGTPEGAVAANPGSVYLRADGSSGTSFYIKESGTGNTGWVAMSSSANTTLQTAYDASASPAQITTSSAAKRIVFKSGSGFNSATAFQVIPDGTTTPTLNVDTSNSRIGIGLSSNINSKLTFAADTTAAGGILFGTDTNLYRSAANVLATDDSLQVTDLLNVGTGAMPTTNKIRFFHEINDQAASEFYYVSADPNFRPAADVNKSYYGMIMNPRIWGTNATGNLTATYYGARFRQEGRVSNTRTISAMVGGLFQTWNIGEGGTMANVATQRAGQFKNVTDGGTTTNAQALYIENPTGAGTITTNYGLYIENQTKGGTNWSIYSDGGNSYHSGALGVGTTSIAGKVTSASGSTTGTDGSFTGSTTFTNPAAQIYRDNSFTTTISLSGNQAGNTDHYGMETTVQTANNAVTYAAFSQMRAFTLVARHQGSSSYPELRSLWINPIKSGTGAVTEAKGIDILHTNSNTGAIGTGYGIYLRNPTLSGGGTMGTMYGLYINNMTAATTNYAIYSNGGQSYHAGNIGIGVQPDAQYQILANATKDQNLTLSPAYRFFTNFNPTASTNKSSTGVYSLLHTAGSQQLTSGAHAAMSFLVQNLNSNTSSAHTVSGFSGEVIHQTAGTANEIYGGGVSAYSSGTVGTVGTMYGLSASVHHDGVGTVNNIRGIFLSSYVAATGTGNMGDNMGMDLWRWGNFSTAGGTVTAATGIRIRQPTATGFVGTIYGLRIEDMNVSGSPASTYALYFNGTSGSNKQGIWWNGDTNLYRVAADVLQTDDQMKAALGFATTGSSATSDILSGNVTGDSNWRFTANADGKLEWGSGSTTFDTNLYRDSAGNILKTDDRFIAAAGLTTKTVAGTPTDAIDDGSIQVDTTNHKFYFRSGSTWRDISAASTTLQAAYDNSSSPATITTTSSGKSLVLKSGSGFNAATAFQVIPDGTTTPTLNVDTSNKRLGVRTDSPSYHLHVPWVSGDTVGTAYFGSSNAGNDQVAVTGQTGDGVGIKGTATELGGYGVRGEGQGTAGIFINTGNTASKPTLISQAGNNQFGDLFQAREFNGITPVFAIAVDGKLLWGGSQDTNLYRAEPDVLQTDDALQFRPADATTNTHVLRVKPQGDNYGRFQIQRGGILYWGDGSSDVDTSLYRASSGNLLKTDDEFSAVGYFQAITTKTADYTATAADSVILVNASSGAVTIALPTAAGISGRTYHIKKIDNSGNQVLIDGNGTETIDGAADKSITTENVSYSVVSDGANWRII